uniref:Uncharacterized protein n=1 Tax=Romanomermis culicivorax TaxID=13658 RepID=A0A915K636_ROMCU
MKTPITDNPKIVYRFVESPSLTPEAEISSIFVFLLASSKSWTSAAARLFFDQISYRFTCAGGNLLTIVDFVGFEIWDTPKVSVVTGIFFVAESVVTKEGKFCTKSVSKLAPIKEPMGFGGGAMALG